LIDKDTPRGRALLLWDPNANYPVAGWYTSNPPDGAEPAPFVGYGTDSEDGEDTYWDPCIYDALPYDPTHWMPLPQPPQDPTRDD
jgi:hypothetical protein